MKVAILIDALNQGGAERQVLNTTWALARRGCDVELIYYYPRDASDPAYEHAALREARVTCIPKAGRRLRFSQRLAAYLRRGRFDVVHAFKSVTTLYAFLAGRLAGARVILGGCQGEYEDRGWVRLGHHLVKGSLAGWVVNARVIVTSLEKALGVDPGRCFVVYNGIDPAAFHSDLSPLEARRRLGLPDDAPTVTMIAGLRPVKNHELYLAMAGRLLRERPRTRFLLAGDGELRQTLQERARSLGLEGQVHFLGARRDIPEILAATDVSVLTSHTEGLPNAMIESMSAGRPVVTTDYPGAVEFLRDGVEGFIVPRGNADVLADRVRRLLDDAALRRRMGEEGARTIASRFSMERMAQGFQDVYEQTIREASGRPR